MSEQGLLIVFSGPSGSGKGTILKHLLKENDKIKLSISATTRTPRTGEEDGVDYFYLTKEDFLTKIDQNNMLEYAEYCSNFYGTPREPIEEWMSDGYDVILEIEVQGSTQVKEKLQDCVSIFILPPSMQELENRLRTRNTEKEEAIQNRLYTARKEISKAKEYDYVVVNNTVEAAAEQIKMIIAAEKLRCFRSNSKIERMLQNA